MVGLSKTHLPRGSTGAAIKGLRPPRGGWLDRELTGQLLGRYEAQELRIAGSFRECRGLTSEQLEDVYQDAALALLDKPFESEAHLRNRLRTTIKHLALNAHRDERLHQQILKDRAADIHSHLSAQGSDQSPEQLALASEDRWLITEFLAELDAIEQKVFWLSVENGTRTGYHRIALALGISPNQAQNAVRASKPKHERWLLLYRTGRLCGYRSQTITALREGHGTSQEHAQRAAAHLQSCLRCRSEHHITARRLQRAFEAQAAALLPIPALATSTGWLRAKSTARHFKGRLASHAVAHRVAHGRLAALYGSDATGAKLARLATVAALAGGTLGATHALAPKHHAPAATRPIATSTPPPAAALLTPLATRTPSRTPPRRLLAAHAQPPRSRLHAPGYIVVSRPHPVLRAEPEQRAPGGFAYLGVPTSHPPPAPKQATHSHIPGGGGEFSP